MDTENLSTDQRYLLKMYNAVKEGVLDESLSSSDPGNLSHARWLTSANRFLRLYVATPNPSENLTKIINYIMKCYVPTWFSIKAEESIFKGSKHLFGLIQRCQNVDSETKEIVRPVIQRNSFFAHSECVLLSMLNDLDCNLRKLACARIRKARNSITNNSMDRRVYELPVVNFDATSYIDMISWRKDDKNDANGTLLADYTDPPILSGYSMDEIDDMADKRNIPEELYSLPCHNQKVERAIKLVSETSNKATDKMEREGIIRNVLASREEMPKCDTKKHLRVKWNFPESSSKVDC